MQDTTSILKIINFSLNFSNQLIPAFELPLVLKKLDAIQGENITKYWQSKYTLMRQRFDPFKDHAELRETSLIETCTKVKVPLEYKAILFIYL